MTGRLYTLGYAAPNSERRLSDIMDECEQLATIVDVRAPHSRWATGWNRNRMSVYWGFKYVWKGVSLGNLNYKHKDKPIVLPSDCGPDEGVPWLVNQLKRGRHLILLCACASYDSCHRKVIVEAVKSVLPDVEVHID